jgi:hypothetical protein
MSAAPTPFHEAYPAPWRIQGAEIVDAEGCNVNHFEVEDAEELIFWQGVVDAVNFADVARRERVMQAARAL